MGDVTGDGRFLRDTEDFIERRFHRVALASNVGLIDPTVLRRDLCHLDQLLGAVEAIGRVHERGVDPESAVLHGSAHHVLHPGELLPGRGAVVVAHHHLPWIHGADVRGEVDRWGSALEAPEVIVERSPIRLDPEASVLLAACLDHRIRERRDRLAFAFDLEGHSLGDLARGPAVHEESPGGVAVHVDEAGTNDLSIDFDATARARA